MREKEIPPSTHTINCVIRAASKIGDINVAY